MHSSISSSLLILLSMFLISIVVFFSSGWLFFKNIFYLIKIFTMFIFLIQISILITNYLNSLSSKLITCFSIFFRVFSCVCVCEINSFIFSFCLTLSVSMKLGKTVTNPILEGVSFCGSILIQFVCAQ